VGDPPVFAPPSSLLREAAAFMLLGMRSPDAKIVVPATLVLGALVVAWAIWRHDRASQVERLGFQDSDAPLMMPADGGEPDPRFQFMSAWTQVQLPQAIRFDPPLGTEHAALSQTVGGFLELDEDTGGLRLGVALAGIGGGNSGLGDPVYAVADGLVLFAGRPSPESGHVVVLGHRRPDGSQLQSVYGHLDRVTVAVGSLVARGSRIGSAGTAGGRHPARLHFELRGGGGLEVSHSHAAGPLDRLDPAATLDALRGAEPDMLGRPPLQRALQPDAAGWTTLEIGNAHRLSELVPDGEED
jgi:hypothetical protein